MLHSMGEVLAAVLYVYEHYASLRQTCFVLLGVACGLF